MAITKPSWLRSALERLNWDIFTWKIYVGDAIEVGIDWALGWINWAIAQAGLAYNKALEARDKAVEVGNELVRTINTEISRVRDKISTWWGDLGDWWVTKVTWIRDLVAAASNTLRDIIGYVNSQLTNLSVAWDNFRTAVLPGLINLSWWTSFWGGAYNHISDWWAGRRQEITDQIDTEVSPVRDEVNKQSSWWETIKGLISDPLGTVLAWLLKVTKSHQELMLKLFDKVMAALWE